MTRTHICVYTPTPTHIHTPTHTHTTRGSVEVSCPYLIVFMVKGGKADQKYEHYHAGCPDVLKHRAREDGEKKERRMKRDGCVACVCQSG